MALPYTSWCSKSNPQPGCSALSNICKPMNASVLATFKNLQAQINRVLYKQGKSLIGVDGRIGPGTVRAANSAMGTNFSNCNELAAIANVFATQVSALASSMGAPMSVASPQPAAPPSVASGSGAIMHPPDGQLRVAGFMSFLKSPLGMAVGVGTALALYSISQDTKKGKRRKR